MWAEGPVPSQSHSNLHFLNHLNCLAKQVWQAIMPSSAKQNSFQLKPFNASQSHSYLYFLIQLNCLAKQVWQDIMPSSAKQNSFNWKHSMQIIWLQWVRAKGPFPSQSHSNLHFLNQLNCLAKQVWQAIMPSSAKQNSFDLKSFNANHLAPVGVGKRSCPQPISLKFIFS